MSRSYRKPFVTDGQKKSRNRKRRKQMANRKVRRKLKNPYYEIGDGNEYKAMPHGVDMWDICDWRFYCSGKIGVYGRWLVSTGRKTLKEVQEKAREEHEKAKRK